ncbi:hypothetical protein [Flagellimonas pacifica]|uniref:NnrS family protein n=1 Tax=Flagellimonas pacifica TaxID=1247520 RepID=A0A285MXT3_9FLAO|nr:hypothetical protein [Allomuricauda parva]SNZ01493.1 hypothetical protein SAMN06265377_3334 [Allomuricauda parva]
MQTLKKHSIYALGYLLLIALLGMALRLFQLVELPFDYRFLVHTHSHVALLGWVYTALTTLIYKSYLSNASIHKKYQNLFWFTQATIVGMLLTFPFTGYALFSIIFSTLFLFASYFFMWLFLKYTSEKQKEAHSYKCIRISLCYMAISSIGPWALGIIMNTAGSGSDLYRNAIYFYLHFQYNGWFIIALLGLFLYILEQREINLPQKTFRPFFWMINLGVVLTFGISLLWMKPHFTIYIFSAIGSILQLLAMGVLMKSLYALSEKLKQATTKLFFFLMELVALLFLMKLIFQLIGTIPYFALVISSNIDLIIGYLHWTFLGVISTAILAFLSQFKLIHLTKRTVILYLIGFFLTEALLFYKGLTVWLKTSLATDYLWYLAAASSILLLGIINIFINQFRKTTGN